MSTTTRFRVGRLNLILHSYRAQFGSLRETFVPLLESWSHYALLAFFESSRRIESESQADEVFITAAASAPLNTRRCYLAIRAQNITYFC